MLQHLLHDIPLTVLGGHCGYDDVQSLVGRELCDFGNATVVLDAGFRSKLEVRAKAGAHFIAINDEHRNIAIHETCPEALCESSFASAGAAEQPENFRYHTITTSLYLPGAKVLVSALQVDHPI